MTREEAVKIINCYDMGFYDLNGEKISADKLADAFDMAIEALTNVQNMHKGKWIFNPTDAIELMFTKPKCSECGFESSDGGNFCPNCGARMKGGEQTESEVEE